MRLSFRRNPYSAGQNLLSLRTSVSLSINKQAFDSHKKDRVSHPFSTHQLSHLDGLPSPPSISCKCKSFSFKRDKFLKVLLSHKNNSSPGLSGILYTMHCTALATFPSSLNSAIVDTTNFRYS